MSSSTNAVVADTVADTASGTEALRNLYYVRLDSPSSGRAC